MNPILQRIVRDSKSLIAEHQAKMPYLGVGLLCLVIYWVSATHDSVIHVYKSETTPDFKDARILGSQGSFLYEGKERLLNKSMRDLMAAQASLRESNEKLQAKIEAMEKGHPSTMAQAGAGSTFNGSSSTFGSTSGPTPGPSPQAGPSGAPAPVVHATSATENFSVAHYSGQSRNSGYTSTGSRPRELGASIISFPVKDVIVEKSEGVALPAGSYVKGKLMTGIEAPEGKTYPVLLQLDFAYITPNKHKLDLSGCFMIAKSQGDLSTERVQMQASKLSCVSKEGKMFERDVNGFIADDKDNSFAVMGTVNSKQDRVAAMAFLSSIAEGVGKGIQQAQTTQQTNALGGAQSVVTRSQLEYMGAGGASNAASLVTSWYLKQAQNLLPTINVGSGQDVWIVMQDTVKLPNDYFKRNMKGGSNEGIYTYFSRIVD